MAKSIYITRSIFDEAVAKLKREVDVRMNADDRILNKSQLIDELKSADGAITFSTDTIDREVLKAAPRLKVVANVAVGFNNIDVEAATAAGIAVTNTPGVLTETTADFAWALLMAAARRVVESDRYTRAGKFKSWGLRLFLGNDVYGKTLGIIGLGRIGQAVARRAAGFNMKILFYSRESVPEKVTSQLGAQKVSLEELLKVSDFISLHVPLSEETKHMLNDQTFSMMKPGCVVVNTSRGPVVDEKALVRALKGRKIAAAALDVYEREPEIEPELFNIESVILAPHIASASHETRLKMCMMAADNLLAVFKGQRPPNLVNPDVWEARHK